MKLYKRYFTDTESKEKLNQPALGWPIVYSLIEWLAAAGKNTRSFQAWEQEKSSWEYGEANNKDSLNGKEEYILRGQEVWNETKMFSKGDFKEGELLGASTLIKRFWHKTWLKGKYGFTDADFSMPNTHAVANNEPFEKNEDYEEAGYYAIIALDGDQIGKWLSGSHPDAPKMGDLLSPKAKEYYQKNNSEFLNAKRQLTPSYHLQFSEMLSNFALYTVRPIVESFDGRLIYAGGDDVLAMLPAKKAINCAKALRAAFRGDNNELPNLRGIYYKTGNEYHKSPDASLFQKTQDGYVRISKEINRDNRIVSQPVNFSVMVPGMKAEVSAGISIGHAKEPLQDMVREAQKAEKRAKRKTEEGGLGRAAVAVTLFKRSGEIVEWGCQWKQQQVLEFYNRLLDHGLGSRFPYKFMERIEPYLGATWDTGFKENIADILSKELEEVLNKAEKKPGKEDIAAWLEHFRIYWENSSGEASKKLEQLYKLFQLIAWMNKK
jgi:CRISPR-associated protein Cas10/Cmr2 subtype III-B